MSQPITHHDAWALDLLDRLDGAAEPIAPGATWHVAAPVGDLVGPGAVRAGWLDLLHGAIVGARRRSELLLTGPTFTGPGRWVAWLGHYVGTLHGTLFGAPAHDKLVFLRCGEFYRVVDGTIVEAYVLPDVPDLWRQSGHRVFPQTLGSDMLFPGPATHDGVLPEDAGRSAASLALVEAMLADLRHFDKDFASARQTGAGGYWHPDMLWYGPAGIGANVTYAGFQRDHRVPFLTAFPDRVGGNHFARFGCGDYVASGGWPSMTMTHRGPYLGIPATGRALTLRVMDFWRLQDGSIRENWVLLDLVDLCAQMGHDILRLA